MEILEQIIARKRADGEIIDFSVEETSALHTFFSTLDVSDFLHQLESGAADWLKTALKNEEIREYVVNYLNRVSFEERFHIMYELNGLALVLTGTVDIINLIQHIRDAYIGIVPKYALDAYTVTDIRGLINKLMDYDIKCTDILNTETHFIRLVEISKHFKERGILKVLPNIRFKLSVNGTGHMRLVELEGDTESILDKSLSEIPKDLSILDAWNADLYEEFYRHILLAEKHGVEEFTHAENGKTFRTILRMEFSESVAKKYIVGDTTDITSITRNERVNNRLAYYDNLTSLANRELFLDRIKEQLKIMAEHKEFVYLSAVMFIDIDDFKTINDTYGHDVGDGVLREVARRLKHSVRQGDLVSRHSGDEFNILCRNIKTHSDIEQVASRIMRGITSTPFKIGNLEFFVSLSLGIAVIPDDSLDVSAIMKHADIAMYAAKNSGKNNYRFFDNNMIVEELQKEEMKNELRKALERKEFFLEYLLQYDNVLEKIIGMESLIRWNHPTRGEINALQFISVAENSGLILDMGYWALEQGCREVCYLQEHGFPHLTLSVNFSQLQFSQPDLIPRVSSILATTHFDPRHLIVEITEETSMDKSPRTLNNLDALKEMGIKLCLDDFGTGLSNLSEIHKVSFSGLKLNRAFTQHLTSDADSKALIKAYIAMGLAMRVDIIAAAVETPSQMQLLSELGCNVYQGYLFGMPTRYHKLVEHIPVIEAQFKRA